MVATKSELVMTISCSTITSGVSDARVATAMCGGAQLVLYRSQLDCFCVHTVLLLLLLLSAFL